MKRPRAAGAGLAAMMLGAATLHAQSGPHLSVEPERGSPTRVPIAMDRGYAAVSASLLGQLGWAESFEDASASFVAPSGATIEITAATPYFFVDDELLQLSHTPYGQAEELHVPLQLFSDFLPRRFPEVYAFDGPTLTLRAGPAPAPAPPAAESAEGDAPAPGVVPSPYEGVRVVIIDAGHGGVDPGAIGVGGVREKNVALAISLALAEVLRGEPDLEVHLLRDDDSFIELWDRGQIATDLRGERPGVFISIHANSFPNRGNARGFETYFLSEARTDHERRVAAIENAPISVGGDDAPPTEDLDFILRELRNLDHQHWSALLAGNIQEEVERVHPGPNRGVKQAPLAVITNALMPSVLVEIGYLSDAREARLLARESFQQDAARAIGRAVIRFFERYPPGSGGGEGRR